MALVSPQQYETGSHKTPSQTQRNPKCKFVFPSPNIKGRVQEREELSNLNDRLAAYIDRVRSLESTNLKLSIEVNQAQESRNQEVSSVKEMYVAKLAESRGLLDDVSKEKALLKLENEKLNTILASLRPSLQEEQAFNKHLQEKLHGIECCLNEKENLLAVCTEELSEFQNEVKILEMQLVDLKGRLAKDQELLEKETIARVDAENRYLTLKDELKFTAMVHMNEINEARQSTQTDVLSYNVHVKNGSHCDGVLQDKLQELREEFEEEAENAKQDLEDAYKTKFEEMRELNEGNQIVISKLLEKQSDFKREVDALKSDNNVLSSEVEQFQKRILHLENTRAFEKEECKHQTEENDAKFNALQNKYVDLQTEYESLVGIKIAMDMELAAYNKLLQGEEQRLNLPTCNSRSSGTRHSRKRGHEESEEYSKPCMESLSSGAILFSHIDPGGKFLTIMNNSNEDEELGGYFIHRLVDGGESNNDFTFPNNYVLQAHQSVTIWSESQDKKPNPPFEFVLEGDWLPDGKFVSTTVVNTEFEDIASYTLIESKEHTGAPRKVQKMQSSGESCIVM